MNWSGPLFGVSAALAIGAAVCAALLPRARDAALALAMCLLGTAGACIAMGAGYIALLLLAAVAIPAPAALYVAVRLAPPAEPDRRTGARELWAAAAPVGVFLLLSLLLTRGAWRPAGGALQLSADWLGSRVLTDHSLAFMLTAAVLSMSALGAVALLRPRGPRA